MKIRCVKCGEYIMHEFSRKLSDKLGEKIYWSFRCKICQINEWDTIWQLTKKLMKAIAWKIKYRIMRLFRYK